MPYDGFAGVHELTLNKIKYDDLDPRQQENYNFLKISAVLAEYGFMTLRLSADWQGADFIAQHIGGTFLKVQLKGRLSFEKNYIGKDLYIAFCSDQECQEWYLYPHDVMLARALAETKIGGTQAWIEGGCYNYPVLTERMRKMLAPYKIDATLKPVI
jgi:hypothetical protein